MTYSKWSLTTQEGQENWTCMDFSNFGPRDPNIEISPQSLKISHFFVSLLLTLRHLQNGPIDFNMTLQNVDILFSTCCYSGHNAPGKTACCREYGVREGSLFPYLLFKNNLPTTYDNCLMFVSFLKSLWVSCSIKKILLTFSTFSQVIILSIMVFWKKVICHFKVTILELQNKVNFSLRGVLTIYDRTSKGTPVHVSQN